MICLPGVLDSMLATAALALYVLPLYSRKVESNYIKLMLNTSPKCAYQTAQNELFAPTGNFLIASFMVNTREYIVLAWSYRRICIDSLID